MSYEHTLSPAEQRELLRIARTTVIEFLATGRIPPDRPHRETLLAGAGAFVTLRRADELRGCIGTQSEDTALYRTVQEMAVAAASRDPRFPPVARAELDQLTIEISVLCEHQRVVHPDQIEVGRHGLTVAHAGRRGLLLPQVAAEAAWSPLEFLAHTCGKAGLPRDAWRDPAAHIECFTAQVFDEASLADLAAT